MKLRDHFTKEQYNNQCQQVKQAEKECTDECRDVFWLRTWLGVILPKDAQLANISANNWQH